MRGRPADCSDESYCKCVAHVSCLVQRAAAAHRIRENTKEGEGALAWHRCEVCRKPFSGETKVAASWFGVRFYLNGTGNDADLLHLSRALMLLGNDMSEAGHRNEGVRMLRAALVTAGRIRGSNTRDKRILAINSILVVALEEDKRLDEAAELERECLQASRALYGVTDKRTIVHAVRMLSISHQRGWRAEETAESKKLAREMWRVSRDVLGDDDVETRDFGVFFLNIYIMTYESHDDAPPDDRRLVKEIIRVLPHMGLSLENDMRGDMRARRRRFAEAHHNNKNT